MRYIQRYAILYNIKRNLYIKLILFYEIVYIDLYIRFKSILRDNFVATGKLLLRDVHLQV